MASEFLRKKAEEQRKNNKVATQSLSNNIGKAGKLDAFKTLQSVAASIPNKKQTTNNSNVKQDKETPVNSSGTQSNKKDTIYSDYTPSYGPNKEEYDKQTEMYQTAAATFGSRLGVNDISTGNLNKEAMVRPEFGSYDYFVGRESDIGKKLDESKSAIQNLTPFQVQLYKDYQEEPSSVLRHLDVMDISYLNELLEGAKKAYGDLSVNTNEYRQITDAIKGMHSDGASYDDNGNIDVETGMRESELEGTMADRLYGSNFVGLAFNPVQEEKAGFLVNPEDAGTVHISKDKVKAYKDYEKNKDKTYNNHLGGVFLGNAKLGRIDIKTNDAGKTAMTYDSRDLEAVEVYQALSQRIQQRNLETFTNDTNEKWKSAATTLGRYAPQFLDQQLYGLAGRVTGGVIAAINTGGAGIEVGQRYGAAAAQAIYMYNQTAGAKYIELLQDSGLSVADAKKLAENTALNSAAIEFGLEALLGKMFSTNKVKKGLTAITGKTTATIKKQLLKAGISEGGAEKIIKAGINSAKIGLDGFGEGVEEWLQQGVEITATREAKKGNNPSLFELAFKTLDLSEYTSDDYKAMNQSALAGMFLGYIGGGIKAGSATVANRMSTALQDRSVGKEILKSKDSQEIISRTVLQGLDSNNADTAALAQKVLSDIKNTANDKGAAVDINRLGKLFKQVATEQAEKVEQTTTEDGISNSPEAQGDIAQAQHNVEQSLAGVKSTLGENGSKAFDTAYDADTQQMLTPAEAVQGFTVVYNAARDGRTLTEAQEQIASVLPAHMRFAAESSGQQDAAIQSKSTVAQTSNEVYNISSSIEEFVGDSGHTYTMPQAAVLATIPNTALVRASQGGTATQSSLGLTNGAWQTLVNAGLVSNDTVNQTAITDELARREQAVQGTRNTETRGANNGTGNEIHLRGGSQRTDSKDTGRQVRTVEEGTGRNQSGQEKSRPADGGTASLTYGEKVSTASLGIGGGSSAKNIRIVTGGDTASTRAAKQIAKQRGLRLILFAGNNLTIKDKNGEIVSARAYISGDRMFVRVDHSAFTADQLARHEAGHDMIAKGEIDPNDVRDRIAKTYGSEQTERLANLYAEAYEGTQMTPDEIWEEVICDSLGDMNIFAGTTSESKAATLLGQTKQASAQSKANGTRGSPTSTEGHFSRESGKRLLRHDAAAEVKKAVSDKKYDKEIKLTDSSPSILTSQKGVRNLPMMMIASHIRENVLTENEAKKLGLKVNPHINYHGLGEELFLQVIDELDNVTEAYRGTKNAEKHERRENYFLLISKLKDANGDIINVPVYINEHGVYNRVFIDTNKVATVFGRIELRKHIEEQLRKRNLVRIKNRSTQTSESPSPINGDYSKNASNNSIKDKDKNVNGNFSRELPDGNNVELTEEQSGLLGGIQESVRKTVREELDKMGKEYGFLEAGENPVREANVPKKTAKNKNVSQTVRTVLEAGATPDTIVPDIEELIAKGDFSYDTHTDKQAIDDAQAKIKHLGWEQALMDWTNKVKEGNVSKDNTAMGWALYNNAANEGKTSVALEILDLMVGHQRNAAQAVQATRILKKMNPETQLYGVKKSVDRLQEEINERYGEKKASKLEINQELAEKLLRSETQEERDKVLNDIYRDIGRQLPSRFIDKWNAWRYLAMLGNARTHVRNVVGNLAFAPVVLTKSLTATAIESVVSRISGGSLSRTKSMVGFSNYDRKLISAAWADYENVKDIALGQGKYNDAANMNRHIEEGRKIFTSKLAQPIEWARKANSSALDFEDMMFSKPHYAYAFAQYCKTNGINPTQIKSGKGLEQARAYAIKEAQKATYRDTNAFSQMISELGRTRQGDNVARKVVGTFAEGILPFRKTPANILARGVEYSPAGLLKSLTWDLRRVKNGEITAAEAIDNIAAGLTGTGLLMAGIWLASMGLVRGHGGDDEDKTAFEEMQGHQPYSLELPDGTSVTLDWLAPMSLPFFVGVNLWEQTEGADEPITLSSMLTATSYITEPMLEMSCLQSLNDLFDAVGYAKTEGLSGLTNALVNASTSYLTQALPTIFGQIERSGEDKRYSTYTEKNAFLTSDMQYFLGKISAKLPFDYQQIPYIDAWGRTEETGGAVSRVFNNMLNPAYTSKIDTRAAEKELLRLYEVTGDSGVFPDRATKYFNVDGNRKDLTAKEYVQYATKKGQNSYAIVQSLISSKAYASMSNDEKIEAVKDAYDMADKTAKAAISDYEAESWVQKAQEAEKKYKIPASTYIILKNETDGIESLKDTDGDTITNSKSLLIMQAVYNTPGLTDKQRQAMFEYLGVGKTVRGYNKALVNQKLAQMKKAG